jgi:hypothetical protein
MKKAYFHTRDFKIGQYLSYMVCSETFDNFCFNNNLVVDNEIGNPLPNRFISIINNK